MDDCVAPCRMEPTSCTAERTDIPCDIPKPSKVDLARELSGVFGMTRIAPNPGPATARSQTSQPASAFGKTTSARSDQKPSILDGFEQDSSSRQLENLIGRSLAPTLPRLNNASAALEGTTARVAEFRSLSDGPDTLYFSRTGELVQYDDAPDPSRARTDAFKTYMSGLSGEDTVSVEARSAFGDHDAYLDDFDRAVAELGLPPESTPGLEALVSGIYPIQGSERANAYRDAGVLLSDTPDKFGRMVPDILHPAFQEELDARMAELVARPGVTAVAFDDHLAVPKANLDEFFRRHPGGRAAAEDRVMDLYQRYSEQVRGAGKEFTVSTGGIGLSREQLVDPARLVDEGLVDRLEFQVYRSNPTNFNNELAAIEQMVRANPADFAQLNEMRIAIIETANGRQMSEAEKRGQVEAVNALNARLQGVLGPDGPTVGVAYWNTNTYFDG